MFTTLKTAAIAGLIGLTSLAAVPAQADGPHLVFGQRHDDARFGFFLADGGRLRDHLRERELRRVERSCTPQRALDKAQRIGVRRARVDRVGRGSIGVIGRLRGERIRVTFTRAPNCPVARID